MPSLLEHGVLLHLAAAPVFMAGFCLSHLHLESPPHREGRMPIWLPIQS